MTTKKSYLCHFKLICQFIFATKVAKIYSPQQLYSASCNTSLGPSVLPLQNDTFCLKILSISQAFLRKVPAALPPAPPTGFSILTTLQRWQEKGHKGRTSIFTPGKTDQPLFSDSSGCQLMRQEMLHPQRHRQGSPHPASVRAVG